MNPPSQLTADFRQSISNKQTLAVLLCGGESRRMGGIPKQTLRLGQTTFLETLYRTLDCFDERVVSINTELDGYPVVRDIIPNIGPMGGIHAAFHSTAREQIFVTACDTPNLSRELIFFLFSKLGEREDCLIPRMDGREHPLCAVYRRSALPVIEEQIRQKDYRMRALLRRLNTHYVDVPVEFSQDLANINTPELYQALVNRSEPKQNILK